MEKNIGTFESIIRILLGVLFLLSGYFYSNGVWQIVLYVVGIILLITGISSRCYLYKLLGINTYKKKTENVASSINNAQVVSEDSVNNNVEKTEIETKGPENNTGGLNTGDDIGMSNESKTVDESQSQTQTNNEEDKENTRMDDTDGNSQSNIT